MEDEAYFRQKAAQCRRLAASVMNQNDKAVATLMAMAHDFEARAALCASQQMPAGGAQ